MKPILPVLLILRLTASAACAREPAAVWFSPDSGTPDYTDLFSKPQLWPKARQRVDVIKLSPVQTIEKGPNVNDLTALQRVDAFRKMQQWNIDIAIEAPAVRPGSHGRQAFDRGHGVKGGFAAGWCPEPEVLTRVPRFRLRTSGSGHQSHKVAHESVPQVFANFGIGTRAVKTLDATAPAKEERPCDPGRTIEPSGLCRSP